MIDSGNLANVIDVSWKKGIFANEKMLTIKIAVSSYFRSGLPDMKMRNWPKYKQKLAKTGHFKT